MSVMRDIGSILSPINRQEKKQRKNPSSWLGEIIFEIGKFTKKKTRGNKYTKIEHVCLHSFLCIADKDNYE
jgi:hypothetical protein